MADKSPAAPSAAPPSAGGMAPAKPAAPASPARMMKTRNFDRKMKRTYKR